MQNASPSSVGAPFLDEVRGHARTELQGGERLGSLETGGPVPIGSTLGARVSGLRNKAGLRQLDLAARVGISRAALAQWETDQTQPSLEKIAALSRVLGCSPAYLAFGTSDSKKFEDEFVSVEFYTGPGTIGRKILLPAELKSRLEKSIDNYKIVQASSVIDNRYIRSGDCMIIDVSVRSFNGRGLYAWETDLVPCAGLLVPLLEAGSAAALLHVDGQDHLLPMDVGCGIIGKVVWALSSKQYL